MSYKKQTKVRVTNLIKKYWAVDVPIAAYDFKIVSCALWFMMPPFRGYSVVDLPPGKWKLVGISNELKENECKKIVEWITMHKYRNYLYDGVGVDSDLESFTTLLLSKGLNKRYAIIKLNGNGK